MTAVATSVAPTTAAIAIGPTIDKLFDLRESKRKLEEQIGKIEAEYKSLEESLMEKLDAEGSTKGAGRLAGASITSSVVPNVTDWDKFYAYISKTKFYHLLHKRPSDAAVRELFEQGKKVPGVEPFTKRRLNVRVLPS